MRASKSKSRRGQRHSADSSTHLPYRNGTYTQVACIQQLPHSCPVHTIHPPSTSSPSNLATSSERSHTCGPHPPANRWLLCTITQMHPTRHQRAAENDSYHSRRGSSASDRRVPECLTPICARECDLQERFGAGSYRELITSFVLGEGRLE